MTLLFWCGLLAPLVLRLSGAEPVSGGQLSLLLAFAVGLLILWPMLEWRGTADPALTWFFPVLALGFSAADGSGLNLPVLWIALAHLVLSRGVRAAAWTGAGFVLIMTFTMVPVFGRKLQNAVVQGLALIPVFGFFIALADLIGRECRERELAEKLLDELATANAELADRNRQVRELAVAEERARLAREVHDSVGHHLTVMRLELANAQRLRCIDPDTAWAGVGQARTAAGDALSEVRRAVRALEPAPLAATGLPGALDRLAGVAA